MGRLLDEDIVIDALIGISGSKSIEELTEECEVYQSDNRCYSGGVYGAIRAIKTLTSVQPEPQWIPVSERLPEKGGEYLVSVHHTIGAISVFHPEKNTYVDDVAIMKYYGKFPSTVRAWMPLPEPYKPNK